MRSDDITVSCCNTQLISAHHAVIGDVSFVGIINPPHGGCAGLNHKGIQLSEDYMGQQKASVRHPVFGIAKPKGLNNDSLHP